MSSIVTFLSGKKTYIVAIVAGALTVAQALGYPIPDWVWGILGAAGLGSLRSSIGKAG